MKNQQGIVWTPVLIMIGVVAVTGVAAYLLIQAGNTNETENNNANVAVVNQANNNANENVNTNSSASTNQVANNNASVNTNTTVNTNATSNSNSTTDPTAGWKTYTNTTYDYSIKYPSQYSPSGTDHRYQFMSGTAGQPGPLVVVVSHTESNGDEIVAGGQTDFYDNRVYDWGMAGFPTTPEMNQSFSNKTTEKLGENTFTVFDYDQGGSLTSKSYFLVKNKIVYRLTSWRPDAVNKTIISTLTFTD